MTETTVTGTENHALIRQWLPLAYKVAKQYTPTKFIGTAEASDIQAAALEGLVLAARRFDPKRSLPFYGFDTAADAEQRRKLRHAIDQLPHRTADVMRMFYFDELSYVEIGRRMNVTRQRVFQILQQGTARVTEAVRSGREEPLPVEVIPLLRGRPSTTEWSLTDANGFSTHYTCNGTGKVRTGPNIVRACKACNGVGHRRLAEPLASAV